MKIALISYEYPPDTGFGGIGTYTYQVAHMLKNRGHLVEVFAGGVNSEESYKEEGLLVHRIKVVQGSSFQVAVVELFKIRNNKVQFDIIEGAEHKAEAIEIKKHFPLVPLVVKLHTPSYLLGRLFRGRVTLWDKLRFLGGGILKGKYPKPFWVYEKNSDQEYHLTKTADTVLAPSLDIARIVSNDWDIPKTKIQHLPNLFIPNPDFLRIEKLNVNQDKITITFIGKLERRKGILDLVQAAQVLFKKYASINLLLVGANNHPSPKANQKMGEYINNALRLFQGRFKMVDTQPYNMLPNYLSQTDICVFPSIWENFPYVCLEAMSAGRAVIGSQAGGMAEMIDHKVNGLLVPPLAPQKIVQSVIYLIENPEKRVEFGERAREKVLDKYNADIIGKKTENIYQQVLTNRHTTSQIL